MAKPVGFPTQPVKVSTLGCKDELAGKLTKLSYKTAKEIISGTPKQPEMTFCLKNQRIRDDKKQSATCTPPSVALVNYKSRTLI